MISSLSGLLSAFVDGRAHVRVGDLTYELLVPASDAMRLATVVGERVTFHTLHYLESQGQGASYLPRLIGFASREDRAFFELFTSVKGIGNRKALRAMQLPTATIARAIAERDVDLLKSLPEIGKKTADTIVLDLREKVGAFAAPSTTTSAVDSAQARLVADAVAVLVQLGESRFVAQQLAERALTADRTIDRGEALVTAALRLRDA
ncbi:MAG: Holliday junction branch migration protein RuvA [Phycisphaerales bacterium]